MWKKGMGVLEGGWGYDKQLNMMNVMRGMLGYVRKGQG